MKSMTGYGRGEVSRDGRTFTVEIKTVNHRYFEPSVRISRLLGFLEPELRSFLKERINRGKTDIFVTYENHSDEQGQIWINEERVREYTEALTSIGEKLGLKNDLTYTSILRMPEVVEAGNADEDEDLLRSMLFEAAGLAVDMLNEMREKEGANLARDLSAKIDKLEQYVAQVKEEAPKVVPEYKTKLYERMQTLLGPDLSGKLDEGRLEQELCFFSDKCCIDEELTRLDSHIAQFRNILKTGAEAGKKLDFLTQELNRETNTIASKANFLGITQIALDMKNEIEKIREQIQNLE